MQRGEVSNETIVEAVQCAEAVLTRIVILIPAFIATFTVPSFMVSELDIPSWYVQTTWQ
jgi:hypothetical protein